VKRDFEKRRFQFDYVFPPQESLNNNKSIYSVVTTPVLQNVMEGYNGTIMAYGQTGTGKTFTIVNEILRQTVQFLQSAHTPGEVAVHLSCMQIYNETLSDLLRPKNQLKIRQKDTKFFVDGLHEQQIVEIDQALEAIRLSETNRNVGETSMNIFSSRSHAIYRFRITNRRSGTSCILQLVDLAGSERLKKSNITNERYDETISINSSLTTLGKCIILLSNKKNTHIPFRESKLTRVLNDSIGGNSKTAMVVTLSPEISDLDETVASLNFGQRACKITNRAMINFSQETKGNIEIFRQEMEDKNLKINELEYENLDLMNQINGGLIRGTYHSRKAGKRKQEAQDQGRGQRQNGSGGFEVELTDYRVGKASRRGEAINSQGFQRQSC